MECETMEMPRLTFRLLSRTFAISFSNIFFPVPKENVKQKFIRYHCYYYVHWNSKSVNPALKICNNLVHN